MFNLLYRIFSVQSIFTSSQVSWLDRCKIAWSDYLGVQGNHPICDSCLVCVILGLARHSFCHCRPEQLQSLLIFPSRSAADSFAHIDRTVAFWLCSIKVEGNGKSNHIPAEQAADQHKVCDAPFLNKYLPVVDELVLLHLHQLRTICGQKKISRVQIFSLWLTWVRVNYLNFRLIEDIRVECVI